MLTWIDAVLINRAQRVTDWCTTWFGITKFALVRWTYILWYLLLCADRVLYQTEQTALSFYVLIAFGTAANIALSIYEESRFLQHGSLYQSTWRSPQTRQLLLGLGIAILVMDLLSIDSKQNLFLILLRDMRYTIFLVAVYFESCTPKPPGKSRVQAFIEQARASWSPSTQPAPSS